MEQGVRIITGLQRTLSAVYVRTRPLVLITVYNSVQAILGNHTVSCYIQHIKTNHLASSLAPYAVTLEYKLYLIVQQSAV